MKTELLAPAKDKYTAFAAIDCGADAVYIIYRRTREEMPAEKMEIEESVEEGVI